RTRRNVSIRLSLGWHRHRGRLAGWLAGWFPTPANLVFYPDCPVTSFQMTDGECDFFCFFRCC
ncbi:hypothetical protein INR49_022269, partial [Caranx melampygus]